MYFIDWSFFFGPFLFLLSSSFNLNTKKHKKRREKERERKKRSPAAPATRNLHPISCHYSKSILSSTCSTGNPSSSFFSSIIISFLFLFLSLKNLHSFHYSLIQVIFFVLWSSLQKVNIFIIGLDWIGDSVMASTSVGSNDLTTNRRQTKRPKCKIFCFIFWLIIF